jgi:S1-C subfamily serine protease
VIGVGLGSLPQPNRLGLNAGVQVASVQPGGPAARAGLQVGDVIVAVRGKPVATPSQVIASVEGAAVGEPMAVRINRNGTDLLLSVVPGEMGRPAPR